jgi:hypothetical protein
MRISFLKGLTHSIIAVLPIDFESDEKINKKIFAFLKLRG